MKAPPNTSLKKQIPSNLLSALFASLLSLPSALSAAGTITDDFNDGSINGALWGKILHSGSSSLTESGGFLTTTNRGILHTVDSFTAPIQVDVRVAMQSGLEHFNTTLRTGLRSFGPGERTGLLFSLSNDGNEISIQELGIGGGVNFIANASYSLADGQFYDLSIRDYGNNVELWIDGNLELSASSTYSEGGQIALYSREFSGTSTIDSISISQIPEPSSALLLGLGAFGLAVGRRRSAQEAWQDGLPANSSAFLADASSSSGAQFSQDRYLQELAPKTVLLRADPRFRVSG